MNVTTVPSESLDQFIERMSHIEKSEELIIGSRYAGNTRTIFNFEGQCCWLETFNMPIPPFEYRDQMTPLGRCLQAVMNPPSDHWIHSRLFYTKSRVKLLMKHYSAKCFEEDPYPREEGKWFYLVFKEFEDLMRLVWDIHTGEFKARFGDETKEYQSCIGYMKETA